MKRCYILGYPVKHSLSPDMHNTAFRELGLDYEYLLKSVKPEDLGAFMKTEMRTPEVRGASVTIPHKVEIMKYLDKTDETAETIGAVNTIVNDDGILTGYNTDGLGFARALEETYGALIDAKTLVLGAGGASRAVSYVLATKVKKLIILNRTPVKAQKLAETISKNTGKNVFWGSLGQIDQYVPDVDIIVNTTSLGMTPDIDSTPVPKRLLNKDHLSYDIVYNPINTRFLKETEEKGGRILKGVKMLVYQGVIAFELWTGVTPPVETMIKVVTERLENR